jgi:methyl-accepting chemotaxis protein
VIKLSLKMKLGIGFGALILLMAIMGLESYLSTNHLSDLTDEMSKQDHKRLLATEVDGGIELQTSSTRAYLLTGSDSVLRRREEGVAEADKAMEELSKLLQTEQGKAVWTRTDRARRELHDIQSRAIDLRHSGKAKEAADLLFTERAIQIRADAENSIDELIALFDKLMEAATAEHEQVEVRTVRKIATLALISVLVGIGMAIFIVRSTTGSISRMAAVIQEIAHKNLTIEDMKITSADEIGKASVALNEMKNSLRDIIQSISETAQNVASASEELSSTASRSAPTRKKLRHKRK